MNYYPFNIGDYAGNTRGLSLIEDLAYRRILDAYYQAEGPLTGDIARLVGMRDHAEAVAYVLSTYFKDTPEGWRNGRADEVIAEYHAKAERARSNGKSGGRPVKKTQTEPSGFLEETQSVSVETQPVQKQTDIGTGSKANQEPRTNNQEKQEQKHERVPRSLGRFEDFWQAYPNKKGRKDAEKAWARKGLDAQADLILADVRRRQVHDRDWVKGYVPHGSTYVNAEGWRDGLPPVPLPQQAQMQPSRQMQAIQSLLRVTPNENLDAARLVPHDAGNLLGSDVLPLPARIAGG